MHFTMLKHTLSSFISFFLFTVILLLVTAPIAGQTNPYCANKTALGSTVNVWDWRQTQFDLYLRVGGYIRPQSPFRIVNNSLPVNTQYIAVSTSTIDYEPANGWELLYKNFGTTTLAVDNASFAIYNRYTGIIRVLFYVPNNNGQFNAASLSARQYRGGSINVGTQLFSYNGLPISPLQTARPSQSRVYVQPNHMFNTGAWIILDFPTAYDPCVCKNTSAIEFAPTLQSISKIDLILEGTGKSKAIYSKATGTANPIDVAGRISDGFIGALKRYKDYNDFTEYSFAVPTNKKDGKLQFLSDFKFLPTIGGVLQLLDFFISGKKTSPMLLGYNSNYKFTGDGTLNFSSSDKSTAILTPGSKSSTALASLTPIYNNPLGVFNLMVRPKIKRYTAPGIVRPNSPCRPRLDNTKAYQLDIQSIKYAVNVAAGLQEKPVSIQAALRFRDCRNGIVSEQLTSQSSNPGVYYTPLIDLNCLGDYTVILEEHIAEEYNSHYQECENNSTGSFCTTVDILLLVALKRTNGTTDQETVLSLVYETDIVDSQTPALTGFPTNKYRGRTVAQINASCPKTTILPVDRTYVGLFCASKYNASFLAKSIGDSPDYRDLDNYNPDFVMANQNQHNATKQLTVYPNPTTDNVTIDFPDQQNWSGICTVNDYLGRKISMFEFKEVNSVEVDLVSFKPGLYTVSIYDNLSKMILVSEIIRK